MKTKKMSLNKKTIASLNDDAMNSVKGGENLPWDPTYGTCLTEVTCQCSPPACTDPNESMLVKCETTTF